MVRIKKIEKLPMAKMRIGKSQVRTRETQKELDELASSIKKHGLLSPIVVAENNDGTFEILTGQRRFLACQRLGLDTILAAVLDEKVSEEEAKIISITENLVRTDPLEADYIDACTSLYKKYGGDVSAVADAIGISSKKVGEFIKYDQLVDPLKQMVDRHEIPLKTALRANKAARKPNGKVDPEEAVKFAKELKPMIGIQQDRVVKAAEAHRDKPIEKRLEIGKKQAEVTQVVVTLGDDIHESLQQYADEEGTTQDEAAASLIETGLIEKGYHSNK